MIFDDEISTGGTLMETVHVLDKYGAKSIYAAATHGILVGEAIERIKESPIKELVVTNSVPVPKEKRIINLKVLSIAPTFAEAIKRIHEERPLGEIFKI